jgi:DMSO reductase anchor subunit
MIRFFKMSIAVISPLMTIACLNVSLTSKKDSGTSRKDSNTNSSALSKDMNIIYIIYLVLFVR